MADVDRPDVSALIAALDDPSGAVRTAALRALVRLPLAWEVRLDLDDRIVALLSMRPGQDAAGNQIVGGIPISEVIGAAIFSPAPLPALRNLLRSPEPVVRKTAARALSKARDPSAITELLDELENPFLKPEERADAAQFLSLHDAPEFNDQFRKVFMQEMEPSVRLWLALAIARYGETGALRDLERELDAGTITWGVLDPDYGLLITIPDKLSPYPQFSGKISAYLRKNWFWRNDDLSFFLMDACADKESQPGEVPKELEEDRVVSREKARASLQMIRDWCREHAVPLPPPLDTIPLEGFSPVQATQLISDLVQARTDVMLGFDDVVGNIALNFSDPFNPDIPALFGSYLKTYRTFRSPERKYPMWQIAWLISRASFPQVLSTVLPHLNALDEDERVAAATLIEDVARLRGQARPPVFGGPSSIDDIPAVDVRASYPHAVLPETPSSRKDEKKRTSKLFRKALKGETEPPDGTEPPGETPVRVVNTVLRSPGSPDTKYNLAEPIKPGRDYYFCLNIGLPEEDSGETTPGPLPPVAAGSELLVAIFSVDNGIRLTPGADTGGLKVHKDGAVTVTRQPLEGVGELPASKELQTRLFFPIHMPDEGKDYRLRCNIYHKQLLLQSRLIRFHMGAERDGMQALVSDVDYTLMQTFTPAQVGEFSEHHLSIMLNESDSGMYNFYFCGSDGTAPVTDKLDIDKETFHSAIEMVRHSLRLASWGTKEEWKSEWDTAINSHYLYYDAKKDIPRLTEDLISMAIWGHNLYYVTGLEDHLRKFEDSLNKPGIIQVAMENKPRYYLPLAFIYDKKVKRDGTPVTLCPEFEKALRDGKNLEETACFKGTCRSAEESEGSVVCPGRFWGFRHMVSMPLSVSDADAQTVIPIRNRLNIPFVRSMDLDLDDSHLLALKGIKDPLAVPDWVEATSAKHVYTLMKQNPHIIYFYCHGGGFRHDEVDEDPYLQAGSADKPFRIHVTDICDENIVWDKPRPLIFLNGCHTAAIDPIAAMNLVEPFLLKLHCAGVIGTEITIFEQMATVFAEECMSRFLKGEPLGQAVRGGRLKVLAGGNPLGLVYIPFAPADLKLMKKPPAAPG